VALPCDNQDASTQLHYPSIEDTRVSPAGVGWRGENDFVRDSRDGSVLDGFDSLRRTERQDPAVL
jgi:hypothetical protein